jgi:hypothetical protein
MPDENIVFIETPRGDVFIDDVEEVQDYQRSFDRIMALSLNPSESIDLLDRVAHEMS